MNSVKQRLRSIKMRDCFARVASLGDINSHIELIDNNMNAYKKLTKKS